MIKSQDFFQQIVKQKEENKLSNAILFLCEDSSTCSNVMILTSLLLQYPIYDLFTEKSAEFIRIESKSDLDTKVYPKNNEKLLVADSNEIVYEAFIRPVNMQNKIFIINNIDSSTEEAQNKLLKVLEEPPKNVYFLLSAKSEDKVLSTIKSRCQKVKIPPFSKEVISSVCSDELAIILGDGYLGKTLELSKNMELKNLARLAVSLFTEMKSSKQVVFFSKQICANKEQLPVILQVLSLCIEDMIKIKCESEEICKLTPFFSDLKDVEVEFSIRALCEISKLISNIKQRMEFNANFTVMIDNFLLKLLEVKYLCK